MKKNFVQEVKKRIKGVPTAAGRSEKFSRVSFDDLVFLPSQLKERPIDYYKEKILTKTIIGKRSKKPVELETPIIIGAMSFGALSKEAKIALAKSSAIA